MTKATCKLARWRLPLLALEFDIVYRAGMEHQAADAFSGLETGWGNTKALEDEIPVMMILDQKHTQRSS